MSVATEGRLGPYEITAKLGEGGMGEVYRATDSRLKREVAIKVLPVAFSADRERVQRFEREAQLLAQLQHPYIAAIYGLEESDGALALVMELVEGEDLALRIARGPLPVEEALQTARQIAEALEAAHERGIVHRDLKPQNVKVRPDGTVKVLDFGLAKAMDAAAPSSAGAAADLARSPTLMHSPTLTAAHGTQLGTILGTAAYMAPEQARGGAVDKRADVWAFGVVLWEMLTGASLFAGETVTDTLAGVLKSDVDLRALPDTVPPAIRRLLRRCLERNRKNRLHDVADARIVIDEVLSGRHVEGSAQPESAPAVTVQRPLWRRWLPWAIAAAALIVAAAATTVLRGRPPASVVRSDLAPPGGALYYFQGDFGSPAVLSPDGSTLVFGTRASNGGQPTARLWSRSLISGEMREIAGTDNAYAPFFSPDGRSIGFFSDGRLRTVAVVGGAPFEVAPAPAGRGGVWTPDGTIVYSPNYRDGLWKVPAVGGKPAPLTTVDASKYSSHRWPALTPSGDAVIYLALTHSPDPTQQNALRFVRLDGTGDHVVVGADASGMVAPGRLLFVRGTTLFAQPFDERRGQVERSPVAIAEDVLVDSTTWRAVFTADARRLVHGVSASGGETQVSGFDPTGRGRRDVTGRGGYGSVAVSPDGKRLVVSRGETVTGAQGDLWMLELARGTETRFTLEPEKEMAPSWSPDGRWVYYLSRGRADRRSRILRKAADGIGSPELVAESAPNVDLLPGNVSPDGRSLVLIEGVAPFGVEADIQILALDGSRRMRPFLETVPPEVDARFSPDGKFVSYASLESGRVQVYVAEVGPDGRAGNRWQLSVDGGRRPTWAPDGKRLLFLDERENLMGIDVDPSGRTMRFTRPAPLFSTTAVHDFDSVSMGPDGTIWLVQFGDEGALHMIENWTELLPR